MTTPEERDFIGEVIREDDAERASKVTVIACKVDESCGQKLHAERFGIVPDRVYGHDKFGPVCKETEGEIYVREKSFNELRQQLADVSHERDLLRAAQGWNKTSAAHPGYMQGDSMGRILVWNEISGFVHLLHIDHICTEKSYTHWMPLPAAPSAEAKS